MNKKTLIVLIGILIIACIAISGFFLLNKGNNTNDKLNDNSLNQKETEEAKQDVLEKNDKKVLVAYFSYSGNTQIMAKEIASQTNAFLFEIETDKEYKDLTNEAKEEIEKNERHNLLKKVENINEYDIIFVGFPIWWHSTPVQINTFLEAHNLDGKIVIPFCTSGGSDISEAMDSFKSSCKNCTVLDGLTMSGSSASTDSGKKMITDWIKSLGIFE